jgi:GTPase SAR1 family protein
VDAFSAVVFVATLRRFVQYDSAEDFFVIGPRASGKSLFLVGSYLESQQSQQETSPKLASGDLMSLVEDHQRRSTEGWAVSATDPNEIRNLEFEYVHGDVFPKNVLVSTVDYGGENIGDIPDALTGSLDSMSNAMNRIVEDIRNSDTLICLIDSERFVEEDSLGINVYFDILRATSDDKDILIVATKADYFATEFYEEQNIEAHAYPEEFSEYVNKRLKRRAEVDSLLDTAVESTVHPVFFQTKKLDDGRRVPIRDSAGSVQRVGFEQVLERLGRL